MHACRSLSHALFAGLLQACGGGGGSGSASTPQATVTGNMAAPANGPGDTSNYFPLSAGASGIFADVQTLMGGSPAYVGGYATVSVGAPVNVIGAQEVPFNVCLLYTSPSPRD